MTRILIIFLCAWAALLPRHSAAAPEPGLPLTLTDTAAGYSIALPAGWERMPPELALEKSREAGNMLPVPEDSTVRVDIQGALLPGLPGADSKGGPDSKDSNITQELLILSVPNRAFGLDAATLKILAEPGNIILGELEAALRAALTLSGMTVKSSVTLEDGLRLSYVAAEEAIYRVMEFRFSASHTIVAVLSLMAQSEGEASLLPGTLVIAPDKRIGQERPVQEEDIRRAREAVSSIFAIAGMVLMVLVTRRWRRQVIGR